MRTSNLSPLRYPGGKAKLTKFIADLITFNKLEGCTYVEIFAGGAGAALALLFNKIVDQIVINDYDTGIYAIWYSILNNTEDFCERISSTPVSIDEWHRQKAIHRTADNLLDLGFSTFFLNRTNRSGIIKGGVIGGLEQNGKYKIDCRFSKDELIKRIRMIASFRDRISLSCLDAGEFIRTKLNEIPDKSLIYFDPPYFKQGPELYTNFYNDNDHKVLSNLIKENVTQPWIITYDNCEEISSLYDDFIQEKYSLNYSVSNKYKGKEIIIYSNDLTPCNSKNINYCV